MSLVHVIFLFVAGFLAAALNSVAGGGSFIALPALIFSGVPPVIANATTSVSLWPASICSAIAYRRDFSSSPAAMLALGGASLAGSVLGALLLLRSSNEGFLRLLPWLFLVATVAFTSGGPLGARLQGHAKRRGALLLIFGFLLQFVIAIYGGYFGGGMGVMMLAVLAVLGLTNIHQMNGLKSVLGSIINGVASLTFIFRGAVSWRPGLLMAAGAMAGGYLGASYARRLPSAWIKRFIIALGVAMTAYFFWRS